MAREWQDKVAYIRTTTDGKTKWVKVPDLKIATAYQKDRFRIMISNIDDYKYTKRDHWQGHYLEINPRMDD
tara:strand:- start:282 stop:494 length:213 start_codon:yes stop_codon:yes gene_type:complete